MAFVWCLSVYGVVFVYLWLSGSINLTGSFVAAAFRVECSSLTPVSLGGGVWGGWGGCRKFNFQTLLVACSVQTRMCATFFFSFFLNLQTIRFDYLTGWRHYNILSGFSPLSSECDLVNANKQLAFVTEKQRHLAIVFLSCFCATNPKQMSVCYF